MFSPNNEEKKLDWMYKGPTSAVDREEYLLGRSIDKSLEQLNAAEKQAQIPSNVPKNHVEHECIPPSIRDFKKMQMGEQVDLAQKLQEDPLIAIRKQEEETRQKLLQNPVQLKKLQTVLKLRAKKKRKKDKKRRKNNSDNENINLKEQYAKLKNSKKPKYCPTAELDKMLMDKYLLYKHLLSEEDYDEIIHLKASDASSSDEEDYEGERKKSDNKHTTSSDDEKIPKNKPKRLDSRKARSSSPPFSRKRIENTLNYTQDYRYKRSRPTVKKTSEKNRKNSKPRHDSTSDSESESDENKMQRNRKRLKKRTERSEDSSESSDEKKNKKDARKLSRKDSKQRMKSKDNKTVRKRNKRDSSSDNESEDEKRKSKDKVVRKKKKSRKSKRDCSSSSDDSVDMKSTKNEKSSRPIYPERRPKKPDSDSNKKQKNKHKQKSSDNDSSDGESRNKRKQNYGLIRADGSKIHQNKSNQKEESMSRKYIKKESEIPSQKVERYKRKRLTEEEIERKRIEMVQNAEWRDNERVKNVKKYRENEQKESRMQDYKPEFLQRELLKSANNSTVESRIKSNINNIQRSGGDMSTHFSRRH